MNVIARLEYELTYYDSAVHHFNLYTTRTPLKKVNKSFVPEPKKRAVSVSCFSNSLCLFHVFISWSYFWTYEYIALRVFLVVWIYCTESIFGRMNILHWEYFWTYEYIALRAKYNSVLGEETLVGKHSSQREREK